MPCIGGCGSCSQPRRPGGPATRAANGGATSLLRRWVPEIAWHELHQVCASRLPMAASPTSAARPDGAAAISSSSAASDSPTDDLPQRTIPSAVQRAEEHTSELHSLMRISYAGFCLEKKTI